MPHEVIIEIGPGPGVLTEAFLQKEIDVIAIELDRDFARELPRLETSTSGRLSVLESDVLKVDLEELAKKVLVRQPVVRIVSNIPYHLTKEILLHTAKSCPHPFHAVFMVQEEVARKLTSQQASESLLVNELMLFGDIVYSAFIPKSCFIPMPHVDSALITYRSHPPLIQDQSKREQFLSCMEIAYQHRRKSIASLLSKRGVCEKGMIESWLIEKGFSPTARPDELTLREWIELFFASIKQ